jgi:hypothetical protein
VSAEQPRAGAVAAELAGELPGLSLWWISVPVVPGPVGSALTARLRLLSDRYRGIDAVSLRTRPVVRAYRAFVRQVGLDPDRDRVPAERAALARLMQGGLSARDRIEAACLVAVVETGVGVWALDAGTVAPGGPELRLEGGALAVADGRRVHAWLFCDPPWCCSRSASPASRRSICTRRSGRRRMRSGRPALDTVRTNG